MPTSHKENFKNNSSSIDEWDKWGEKVTIMNSNDENANNSSDSQEQCAELKKSKNTTKKFYEDHPEKLTERITCLECGWSYIYWNKSQHLKSKKHKMGASRIEALQAEVEKLKKQILKVNGD